MPDAKGLPQWISDLTAELRGRIQLLNLTVDQINSTNDIEQQRSRYVALVRDYLEIVDATDRFKFFLKVNVDGFRLKIADGGRALGISFEGLSEVFAGTRNVVFLDTESTGLNEHDEAITIAAVLASVSCRTGRVVREFRSYYGEREPNCQISHSASRVHGISMEQLSGKRFDLYELVALLGAADHVVAHNAEFDRRMLRCVLPDVYSWRCSLELGRWPEDAGGKSLQALCRYFSVQVSHAHDAMADVRALIAVLAQNKGDGRTYLSDLL